MHVRGQGGGDRKEVTASVHVRGLCTASQMSPDMSVRVQSDSAQRRAGRDRAFRPEPASSSQVPPHNATFPSFVSTRFPRALGRSRGTTGATTRQGTMSITGNVMSGVCEI